MNSMAGDVREVRMQVTSDHHNDVTMGAVASQITSLTIVYSTTYWGIDQRKNQCSASLAFVRGIHRSSVNSPHKWPVTRKMFPFDDVIMPWARYHYCDLKLSSHFLPMGKQLSSKVALSLGEMIATASNRFSNAGSWKKTLFFWVSVSEGERDHRL